MAVHHAQIGTYGVRHNGSIYSAALPKSQPRPLPDGMVNEVASQSERRFTSPCGGANESRA